MDYTKDVKYFKPSGYIYDEYDNLFYYKLVDQKLFGMELVIEKLAKKVGLNVADYRIISDGKKYYYLSRDIGHGSLFFTALEIGIKNKDKLDEIKNILMEKFNDERLIVDLYKLYFFDILTMNSDRSNGNYGIRVTRSKNELFILDNEYALELLSEVLINYNTHEDTKKDLKKFLHDKPDYVSLFINMYETLKPKVIKDTFEEVESECCHRIFNKDLLLKKYIINYDAIGTILLQNKNVLRLNK